MSSNKLAAHYLSEALRQLRGHKRMAEAAIAQLDEQQFFASLDAGGNSASVLAKHIAGNQRSRFTDFLTADGEKPDRHRDREFEMDANASRAEVMAAWEQGWTLLFATVESLHPEDVMRTVTIRSEPHTVLQALNRALAHYAQHIGQIVFLAKHLRGREWKTLSIARGESEKFKTANPAGYRQGVRAT